jgi:diguanylate cyclase (GGDEF)-like protein/PAS domain S-box-containing protein
VLSPTLPSPARSAAFDRLSRLAASAVGARAGAVTLLDSTGHAVAGRHGLPEHVTPGPECHRVVASGAPLATGEGYLGVPVTAADGTILGTVCVFADGHAWSAAHEDLLRDVAASVLAELELREAADTAMREQRIGAAVLDVATDCLIRLDANGHIASWSPSAERTFGYTAEEAVGRSLTGLLAPAKLEEQYTTGLHERLAGDLDGRQRVEVVAEHRDGHRMPVELTLVPAGSAGHVAGVRDLTELRRAQQRAEVAERRFRALVEHVPAITYSCDYDDAGLLNYMSPQVEQLTGLPADAFLGDPDKFLAFVHPDDRERVARQVDEDFAAERPFESEYRILACDGTVRWVWDRETIVRDHRGRAVYGQGVIVDLTPMRETQEALEVARRQLASIIEVAPMILTAIDADGIVTYVDGRGLETAGVRREDLIGRHASTMITTEEGHDAIRRALAGETTSACIGSSEVSFDVTWQPVLDDAGVVRGVVAVGIDVTARRRNELHLRHLARHDPLTGAPNRHHLEQEIADSVGELAVVVVDIDGFKTVNDSLGHQAGDDVLRELVRRLSAVASEHGAFLARLGADEFALLIRENAQRRLRDDAESLVHAALAEIREPIEIAGSEFVVSAATGVAIGAPDAAEMLRHADVALGEAKRHGQTLAWYAGECGDARGRLTLTARIRSALANDEFSLHYQPVLDLQDDHVSGVEALIRWNDPERGLVSPDEFIPAAEASGLIDDIGRWVIDEVCRQWRLWADEGMFPAVGFNVAPRELRREDFASSLIETAERHGTDVRKLVVEITERAAMREPERTDIVLRELKRAGVRVAIDDFGADHSSLARLRDLHVDVLKIDRSFLAGVPEQRDAAAIVTAILSLASALGMEAVAEGVETAEQLDFLDAKACRRVQGYHIARPMPAAEVTEFLRRHGPAAGLPRLREVA